jgi:HTH-type transcriptional regulator, sugar sensing transcriptional regulator
MEEKLIAIGFGEYEAKAYLALLRENPATAYEIAKRSTIPTSKVYEVLAKLLERGAVLEIEQGKKRKFLPLSPDELVSQYRNRIDETLTDLQKGLHQFRHDRSLSYIWNILDYDTLMEKARHLLRKAKRQVLLSIWQEEMHHLHDELQQAKKRGVKTASIHFGEHTMAVGQTYRHPIEDTLYAEKGGRILVIAADCAEALVGKVAAGGKVEGAASLNTGFVTMAEDYIKHDIYIMKIVQRFDAQLSKRFGKNYHKLRDVFSNEEES